MVDAPSSAVARGSDGKVTVTFSATDGVAKCSYAAGSYKIRVAFETEYGIIHSELPKAIKVK